MLRAVRDSPSNKMAEHVEKYASMHFVDECDFKEVSVAGKRNLKRKRALGFFLTAVSAESLSEDDEIEVDSSREVESPGESIEEGSCSSKEYSGNEESETKTSGKAATSNRKPKASSSKKTTQARKVKHSLITEDEVEELCDKLEINREERNSEIKRGLTLLQICHFILLERFYCQQCWQTKFFSVRYQVSLWTTLFKSSARRFTRVYRGNLLFLQP